MSWSSDAMSDYASSLQEMIAELDNNNLNKWILDLRGNSGGCLMPMMMGLSPFFDRSEILAAFGLNNCGDGLFYNEKSLSIKEIDLSCSLKSNPYHLQNPFPRIALLIDQHTGSSGEAAAIAFLGLQNVRTFGQKTAGCTSGNVNYILPDGAEIILAYNYMTDLKGKVYKTGITPDEEISDTALDAAKNWLNEVQCLVAFPK
jgi:C-terminal processing protease CtpA/Prc